MCGRFALYTEPTKVARLLQAQLVGVADDWQPSWNVPPTDPILGARDEVDRQGNLSRTLRPYRWGLVPPWAKDPASVKGTFNARAESVASKPMYRSAFERKRILVPADAFYEWKKSAKAKEPFAFRRTDGQPMVFAGLCDHWKAPDGHWLASATIITTSDNLDMHEIHDRMPVILETDMWDRWLDPALDDRNRLEAMLRPPPAGTLEHYPVSRDVGNVRNNSAHLLDQAVGQPVPQLDLG